MYFCHDYKWLKLNAVQQPLSSLWPSVFSELTFTFAICCRPSVCRLSSVTLVHPTQAVQIFGNISKALSTLAIH